MFLIPVFLDTELTTEVKTEISAWDIAEENCAQKREKEDNSEQCKEQITDDELQNGLKTEDSIIQLPKFDREYLSNLYVAINVYEPDNDETMSLHEGETVEMLEKSQLDWWLVKKQYSDRTGLVPKQSLQEKTEYEAILKDKLQEIVQKLPSVSCKHDQYFYCPPRPPSGDY